MFVSKIVAMKKILLSFVALFLISSISNGQLWKLRRYEATASLGTTQFFGDIGGFSKEDNLLGIKDFSFKQTSFNINTSFKYRILEDVSVRLNLAFGSFHSTDARGSNENRGFESKTPFFESAILGEYYFIKNKGENSYLFMKGTGSPLQTFFYSLDIYAFTGLAGLSYKVKPNDRLAPYVTNDKGFIPVLPIGIGANYFFSNNINFGVEIGGRFTFSDDIEGYTSPYSESNDIYHFLNFTFTYKIKTSDNGFPTF
jgi:hypothetical protein